MDFTWIVLVSAIVTAGVIYGIYYFTRPNQIRSPRIEGADDKSILELDEDFLGDVESGFDEGVYRKIGVSISEGEEAVYPDCFGSVDSNADCEAGCGVSEECISTVKILKGF